MNLTPSRIPRSTSKFHYSIFGHRPERSDEDKVNQFIPDFYYCKEQEETSKVEVKKEGEEKKRKEKKRGSERR